MTAITNLLLFLGNHFYFVLIGCAELILTVVLLGILPRRQSVSPRAKLRSTGAERMLIPELARRSDNVCVALRRQDLMTVIAAGNMENILGIKLDALQDDLSLLLDCLDERQAGLVFWQNYRDWNGKTPLQTDLPFKGGEWRRVAVQRSLDQDYPTLENQMKILNAQRYHDPLGDPELSFLRPCGGRGACLCDPSVRGHQNASARRARHLPARHLRAGQNVPRKRRAARAQLRCAGGCAGRLHRRLRPPSGAAPAGACRRRQRAGAAA